MILKSEKSTVLAGGVVIFLLVFVFGLWIGLAPLKSAAVAPGQVGVVDNKKIIQHLEGGVVGKIYVKDGDIVKAGQPLVEIENARLSSEIEIIRNDLLQSSVLVSRLEAQRDGASEIKFDQSLDKFSGFSEAVAAQKSIFNEQNKLLNDELAILSKREQQLQQQIVGTKAILEAKLKRIDSLSEEMREWQRLFKEQLTDKVRLREIEREKGTLEGDVASTNAEISRLNVQVTETKSQMVLRQRSFKEEVLKNLESAKDKLANSKERYAALKDQLERAVVKSPVDGTVVELAVHTIGGVVRPGEAIMSIVPKNAHYIVDAKLNISDIDTVHVGQEADMRFSAFNSRQSHVMQGRVIYVSADSLTDNRGMPYYELKAELTPLGEQELKDNDFFLLPGMPAEVVVKTGERTVLNYMLKPFLDMFTRAFNEE